MLAVVNLGCSQTEPEAVKIPAENQPDFSASSKEGGGGGMGLGNPKLNPNFKPPQRRKKPPVEETPR